MALIVFSHGNGFCASTYQPMLNALRGIGHTVEHIEQLGHNPKFPVTNNWPHLRSELIEFIEATQAKHSQTPVLMGHSLGGILSTMVASNRPDLANSVILLDAFFVHGAMAAGLRLAKKLGLATKRPPASVALRRRTTWDSVDAVMAHFVNKGAFNDWHANSLQAYAEHGTVFGDDGQRHLRFQREIEAAIYASLPDHLSKEFKQNPLQCPVHFVGGLQSKELRLVGDKLIDKIALSSPGGSSQRVQGTHLFPMERPFETAVLVDGLLSQVA